MPLGYYPLGSTPLGGGAPVDSAAPRRASYPAATQFDGATRDFLTDANGRYLPTTPTAQKVALALMVELGSLAHAPDVGHTLRSIRNPKAPDTQTRVEDAVRRALAQPLADGEIKIDTITYEAPTGSALLVEVAYFDLTVPTTDPRRRQTARARIGA